MNSFAPAAAEIVSQTKTPFERVLFDREARERIADIAVEYESKLGLSFVAVKGFIRMAIRRWQIDYEMTIHELRALSLEEQRPHCDRIDNDIFSQLSSAIPVGEQQANLKKLACETPVMMSLLRSKPKFFGPQ